MAGKEDDNMRRRESGNTIDKASIDGLRGSKTVAEKYSAPNLDYTFKEETKH